MFSKDKWNRFPIEQVLGKKACNKMPIRSLEYYGMMKRLAESWCISEIFSNKGYQADLYDLQQPKPDFTIQAYKNKSDIISAFHQDNYSKNNALFSGIRNKFIIGKKTLCLGLQNVLMKISMFAEENSDETIQIDNEKTEISVNYRPFLFEFLEEMKAKFEVLIYCSLKEKYLKAIIQSLEKNAKYFAYAFGENFCIFPNYNHSIKTLDFLMENRKASSIIAVDISAKEYLLYPDNFVPISSYHEKLAHESELIKLASVLNLLEKEDDIREGIRKYRKCN